MAAKPAAEGRSGVWPSDKRAPAGPRGKRERNKTTPAKKQKETRDLHAWTIMDLLGQYVTRIFARSSHRAFTRSCKDFLRDFTADLFS